MSFTTIRSKSNVVVALASTTSTSTTTTVNPSTMTSMTTTDDGIQEENELLQQLDSLPQTSDTATETTNLSFVNEEEERKEDTTTTTTTLMTIQEKESREETTKASPSIDDSTNRNSNNDDHHNMMSNGNSDTHIDNNDSNTTTILSSTSLQTTSSFKSSLSLHNHHHNHKRDSHVLLLRHVWNIVRIVTCDVPLVLLLISLITIYIVRDIYHIYYVPLIIRAQRTNIQLQQEYTYYDRQCTSYDISTHNIQDLLVQSTDTTTATDTTTVVQQAVQQMLQHGAIVIPHLISINTTQLLRQYIVQKNTFISKDELYPVSQGYQRLSYGIDAAEHIHVSTAIQEIVHHPTLHLLFIELLGDIDPASAEITAIINYYGATHQVWHQDTKQDGNAIKFARTYSHSYSLFVPLQDITAAMGPTDICPGTQYCTNDLETMCEENKMGLHQVTTTTTTTTMNSTTSSTTSTFSHNEAIFPAGYGALLNQHVWHRGGAHVDEQALERIVFIVSFVARPFRTIDDQRQLSRGTYFHQKWNMWGHTLYDLTNPMVYMKYPYSIFRCLSIYKSQYAHWGYDLITATYMRFANGQLEDNDLVDRFIPSLIRYGLPSYLHGRVLEYEETIDDNDDQPPMTQYASWTTFIQGTIQNIYNFLFTLNMYAHGIYFGVLLLFAIILSIFNRSTTASRYQVLYTILIRHGIGRTLLTHGTVVILALYGWYRIQSSEWSMNVLSGRTLQRPFPNMVTSSSLLLVDDSSKGILLDENSTIIATNPLLNFPLLLQKTLPNGYTTIPTRYDILFGTRYDAPFLGSYNQWLQYHPGNQIYYRIIDQYRSSFQSLFLNTPINETTIVTSTQFIVYQIQQDVQRQTMHQGRFLQQNWATGDWHMVSTWMDIEMIILNDLKISVHHPIRKQINVQIAYHRFGPYRDTKLSQLLHLQLYTLRQQLLYVNATKITTVTNVFLASTCTTTSIRKLSKNRPTTTMTSYQTLRPRISAIQPWPRLPVYSNHHDISDVFTIPETFQVGTLIWYNYVDSDDWIPGIIMKVHPVPTVSDNSDDLDQDIVLYDITVDDGTWYYEVLPEQLHVYHSVTVNDVVYGCFESGLNDCYSGTVLHVYVSGNIRILYDDGDIYDHVSPSMFYVPPYRYDGPYQS